MDQPYIQRQPYERFQHEESEYPGVVYEIACSQNGRELGKAAWTYIPYSNGNIKAVAGFELGYGKNKEARISMWQPRYLKEGEEGVEILDVEAVIEGAKHGKEIETANQEKEVSIYSNRTTLF